MAMAVNTLRLPAMAVPVGLQDGLAQAAGQWPSPTGGNDPPLDGRHRKGLRRR
jgi:hypothetical protein